MKFDDKRIDSLESIVLENSRVILTQPIIFLCGGQVDVKSPAPLSVRGALIEYLHSVGCSLSDGIMLAEDFKDWTHDAIYRDLLIFESDIAHISSLIVIILESPGALAELGLFVKNKSLKNKILVFIEQKHYEQNSFIRLGPLKYLEELKEASVCAYPWDDENLQISLRPSLKDMREDILSAICSQDKSEAFSKDNEGHQSFALYELIKTFRALKLSEIENYAQKLEIPISREKLKRLLFLLKKFNLIDSKKRGHIEYYYAKADIKKIDFGGKFDATAAKLSAQQFYATNESESRRLGIIKEAYEPQLPKLSTPTNYAATA